MPKVCMQQFDPYKLLYNNLWLHKSTQKNVKHTQEPVVTASTANVVPQNIVVVSKPVIEVSNQISNQSKATVQEVEQIKPEAELINDWNTLVSSVTNCAKCALCHSRQNVVIERGSRLAKWMFIGEGPGEQEDIQGKPFVGASGQLLQKMIGAMQLDPENDVYICNVVKCRPPSNRNPNPEEINQCKNYVFSQIQLVNPQIIVTLGRFAYQTLLNTEVALGKLRLKQHNYQQTPVIVTYHPAYLLRNPSAKKDAWADLQLAMQVFNDISQEVNV